MIELGINLNLAPVVDLLALGNNLVYEEDVAARTIMRIKRLVETGVIGEERIDTTYQRVQRLKHSPILKNKAAQ